MVDESGESEPKQLWSVLYNQNNERWTAIHHYKWPHHLTVIWSINHLEIQDTVVKRKGFLICLSMDYSIVLHIIYE